MSQKTNHKLGVIVPYRDRYDHLVSFKTSISNVLDKSNIDYVLIVIEQDDAKLFNRGKLLNIGFKRALKEKCDYVVFHDVDMLPIEVDYSYSSVPVHLATNFISRESSFERDIFDSYFGGVTIFPIEDFQIINGYSNVYWGWGFEDDDLFSRCVGKGIPYDTKSINVEGGSGVSLKFNGTTSYVESKFKGDLSEHTTILITIDPDDVVCNVDEPYDRYTALSIPTLDLSISYDSFRRFKILFKDENGWAYIDSNLIQPQKTTLLVTIDNHRKRVKFYQDGEMVGEYKFKRDFKKTTGSSLFIGSKDGEKEFFKGEISQVAIFNNLLYPKEITEVSKNDTFSLTMSFGDYISDGNLSQYYDMKQIKSYRLVDLSNEGESAEIVNCEIVKNEYKHEKILNLPFRRPSIFKSLSHQSSGYQNGGWSDVNIRYNQLRFHNEVERGYRDPDEDGLSNCDYNIWSDEKVAKQIHLNVSI
jgi:hypothetical protein